MVYYIVKKAVPARDYPSSVSGKKIVQLSVGTVLQVDGGITANNAELGKVYLPAMVDGQRRWVHDAYLTRLDSRRGRALAFAQSLLGSRTGSRAIRWYNGTAAGKADPKPSENFCSTWALWALDQAGVDVAAITARTAEKVRQKAKSCGRWHKKGGGYTPKPGDLVLYHSGGTGGASHTELLVLAAGDKLYTINGNSSGVVRRMERKVSAEYTYGYVEV